MKNTKRMAALAALGLLSMMFTSCKAVLGNGEITTLYTISNIAVVVASFAFSEYTGYLHRKKYHLTKEEAAAMPKFSIIIGVIMLALLVLIFVFRPFKFFNLLVLVFNMIAEIVDGIIKGKSIKKEDLLC
ncbi:MAG: hypothetical protein ACI4LR_08135 [Treponema sp.]